MEPIKTYLKNNKRGLGADKIKKTAKSPNDTAASNQKNVQVNFFISNILKLHVLLSFFPFLLLIYQFIFIFCLWTSKPYRTLI